MKWAATIAVAIVGALSFGLVSAHGQSGPAISPMPKSCQTPATMEAADSPLPNVARALKEKKKITILAIGSTSASARGPVSGGYFAILEKYLEATFKGVEVTVIHRGVSGELASDAAERIKYEVALTGADIVLWQLGTADALARVPVETFRDTVLEAVSWLKQHNIDVILVGLRYTRSMTSDPLYQAIRRSIKQIGKEQNVIRFGRYDAEEMLEKIRAGQGIPMSEADVTDAGYVCMAEYLARAIATGLFLKTPNPKPMPPPPARRP